MFPTASVLTCAEQLGSVSGSEETASAPCGHVPEHVVDYVRGCIYKRVYL